jgi:predicted NUDIX family NTP pyrophosphohydrolase
LNAETQLFNFLGSDSTAHLKRRCFPTIQKSPKSAAGRARSTISAGLMMFRLKPSALEVLLVHPGGPFFAKKDDGAWTIPKGEASSDEDLLTRARVEFEEELGFRPQGQWIPLGSVKQRGGKIVYAWAFESDLPQSFQLKSDTFKMEWPPRSGKLQTFPEVDRAQFFPEEVARWKINPAQVRFLDRLREKLDRQEQRPSGAHY